MAFLARNEIISDGVTPTVAVPFPYLEQEHVFVYLRTDPDASSLQTIYTGVVSWSSPSLISLSPIPASGQQIIVKRVTPRIVLLDRLTAPGTLLPEEINYLDTQLLYIIQEALDIGLTLEATDLTGLLSDLRYTYDVAWYGNDLFTGGDVAGAHAFVRSVLLATDGFGSEYAVVDGPTTQDHILSVQHNDVEIGTITITKDTDVITPVINETIFAVGDNLTVVTTQDGGMLRMAGTFRMFRQN